MGASPATKVTYAAGQRADVCGRIHDRWNADIAGVPPAEVDGKEFLLALQILGQRSSILID